MWKSEALVGSGLRSGTQPLPVRDVGTNVLGLRVATLSMSLLEPAQRDLTWPPRFPGQLGSGNSIPLLLSGPTQRGSGSRQRVPKLCLLCPSPSCHLALLQASPFLSNLDAESQQILGIMCSHFSCSNLKSWCAMRFVSSVFPHFCDWPLREEHLCPPTVWVVGQPLGSLLCAD